MKFLLITLLLLSTSVYTQEKELPKAEDKPEVKAPEKTAKDIQDAIFVESLDLLEEIVAIIESADSEENTAAAVKKITDLEKKALTVREKFNKTGLNNLTSQRQLELQKKYKTRINSVSIRLMNAIQQASGKKELSEAIKEILAKI